jgi:hypothetical protein
LKVRPDGTPSSVVGYLENLPMAAAFERCGYRVTGRRLVLSAA